MKKAVALAFALTAASVISQMARGDDTSIKISQPLIMRSGASTLIVDCSIPKTYLTLPRSDGGADYYTFDKEGVPTIDATPPTGITQPPDLKKNVIKRMMVELGQRQLQDFSPDILCRDGQPNSGAAAAIMNFVTRGVREFDI
jgi:hypothetical protein